MRDVNIALEVFGIIISFFLFIISFAEASKRRNKRNIFFASMLGVNIAVLVFDLITWIFDARGDFNIFLTICNVFVYSLGYVMTALFTSYLFLSIDLKKKTAKFYIRVIYSLCGLAIILVLISLFNGMYFSFEDGVYKRGDFFWFSQAYPLIIMLVNMVIIFANKKVLKIKSTLALSSYGLFPVIAMIIQILVYGITLLYLSTTLGLILIYLAFQVEQSNKLYQKENELLQANIAIMLSQIQPHFIYNTLAVISSLCSNKEAIEAIENFSFFLRGNMDSLTSKDPIPFYKELAHTKYFVALEILQFPDRINIEYDISNEDFFVPTLTLEPLVENAIKYGLKKKKLINVKISTSEDTLYDIIKIEDDGCGFDPKNIKNDNGSHLGIENVRQRLNSQNNGLLIVNSNIDVGTEITVLIPKDNI